MMRGRVEFGGVPASLHPGKVTLTRVYAHSEAAARETIRVALLDHFKPNSHLTHDANRFFERWIDVKKVSHAAFKSSEGNTFYEFVVYVYLTKTEFVEQIVTLVDDEAIPTIQGAPKLIRITGFHVEKLQCRKCHARGHSTSECLDPCLRIEMWAKNHQVTPALVQEILRNTKAQEVITGHNNKGPCKEWGYIKFHSMSDREEAAPFFKELVLKKV